MLENWFKRHQNKTSLILHAIGIPMTILAIPALITGMLLKQNSYNIIAIALFVIGYALQFIGHHIEGNDAGEIILIKKLLGKKYIDIAPNKHTGENDNTM